MNRGKDQKGRTGRWGLKAKLVLSMLLVGVVPLLVGLVMAFWQGSQQIREVSGESFKALATETARKLDLVVGEEMARTSRIATDPGHKTNCRRSWLTRRRTGKPRTGPWSRPSWKAR